jgi:TRAP-type mannitol/chloroaromatic compound transport system permease small subunit
MKSILQKLRPWADRIDTLNERLGTVMAMLVVVMTAIVVYDVTMRFVFKLGSVALQELEWHLFAVIFLIGAAYTYKHDGHVRVEVFFQKLQPRTKALINIAGNLLFLLPLSILIITSSWGFVYSSWQFNETSPDPGGLPATFLIKATIPLGFALLILQGAADTVRQLLILGGDDES